MLPMIPAACTDDAPALISASQMSFGEMPRLAAGAAAMLARPELRGGNLGDVGALRRPRPRVQRIDPLLPRDVPALEQHVAVGGEGEPGEQGHDRGGHADSRS